MLQAQVKKDLRIDLPRVELDFFVTILLNDGGEIYATGRDLSPRGMGLLCDATTAHTMVARGSTVSPNAGAVFRINWELPETAFSSPGGTRRSLGAQAKLAWSQPTRPHGHLLGLNFIDIEPETDRALKAFIESAMS